MSIRAGSESSSSESPHPWGALIQRSAIARLSSLPLTPRERLRQSGWLHLLLAALAAGFAGVAFAQLAPDPSAGQAAHANSVAQPGDAVTALAQVRPDSPAPLSDPLAQLERWQRAGARFIAQGYLDRAWRHLAADRLEAALADFEQGLFFDPARRDAAFARVRLLARLERTEAAIAAFETLIPSESGADRSDDTIELAQELMALLRGQSRWIQALALLDRLDSLTPADSPRLEERARLLARIGDREGLLATWLALADAALSRAEDRARALDQAAVLAAELGEPASSLALLDRLSGLAGAPPVERRRALTLEQLGDRRGALRAWQQVLDGQTEPAARLPLIDAMLAHARSLEDITSESVLLRAALTASGGQVGRLRDLAVFERRTGKLNEAATLALELAARTRASGDRALAFEILASLERSMPVAERSWSRLAQLATAQADHRLLALIAGQHLSQRRDDAALSLLTQLSRSAHATLRREALLQAAEIHARRGDAPARARALLAADQLPGGVRLAPAVKAQALAAVGQTAQALALLETALASASDRPALLRQMIDLHQGTGDRAAQFRLYQRLAEAAGLTAAERANAHLEAAELARQTGAGIAIAIHHYRSAITLVPQQRAARQALADLLAAQGRPAEAAHAHAQLFRDLQEPIAGLRAMVLYAQDQQWPALDQLAAEMAPRLEELPIASRAQYWAFLGEAQAQAGRAQAAISAWERALALVPDEPLQARRRRLLAHAARERAWQASAEGRLDQALAAWREVGQHDPGVEAERGLGYALLQADQPRAAALSLARAERLGAPQPGLLVDLGHAWLRAGERAQARLAFSRAIDLLLEGPDADGGAAPVNRRDRPPLFAATPSGADPLAAVGALGASAEGLPSVDALRRTVLDLDRSWRLSAWQNWRERGGRAAPRSGPPLSGGEGQAPGPGAGGGIDLAYREPAARGPGYSPFEGFARVLWALETPSGGGIDEQSLQAGLGLRYTIPELTGGTATLERLFAIGQAARNDWLLRASWGRDWRVAIDSADKHLLRGHLFTDAGYYTGTRTRLLFGEWLQGLELRIGADWVLLPHWVVHGRGLSPDLYREGWMEAGMGLSLERRSGGSRHVAARSHWIGSLRYKFRLDGAGREGWELALGYSW